LASESFVEQEFPNEALSERYDCSASFNEFVIEFVEGSLIFFVCIYVYILKSKNQDWHYIGSTGDLGTRFKSHNEGKNCATKAYAPFKLEAYVAVSTQEKAKKLEKYFKTGSGRAVLKKRILQSTKL